MHKGRAGTRVQSGLPRQASLIGPLRASDDPDKLVTFIDQLLFHLRLTRRKARPVTIRESQGVMEIVWRGRVPKTLKPGSRNLLWVSEGRCIDSFTVQAA